MCHKAKEGSHNLVLEPASNKRAKWINESAAFLTESWLDYMYKTGCTLQKRKLTYQFVRGHTFTGWKCESFGRNADKPSVLENVIPVSILHRQLRATRHGRERPARHTEVFKSTRKIKHKASTPKLSSGVADLMLKYHPSADLLRSGVVSIKAPLAKGWCKKRLSATSCNQTWSCWCTGNAAA